jgi:gas vesicle protein
MGRHKTKLQAITEANKRIVNEIAPWASQKGQGGDYDSWKGIKNMLYSLEKQMDEEELVEHIKNLESHVRELIYIQNNQYGEKESDI